jgi:membrane protein required for colicin V production
MNLADLLIIVVLVVCVGSAFVKGFFVEVCSLVGVFVGLFVAAANYLRVAPWIEVLVRNHAADNLIAFLLITLVVMAVAGLAGRLLRGIFRGVGLGSIDRLLGAAVGLVEGFFVVTVILMGIVAFLPRQDWLHGSRLAPVFLTAANGSSHVVPFALGEEIRQGVEALRRAQPNWLAPASQIDFERIPAAKRPAARERGLS